MRMFTYVSTKKEGNYYPDKVYFGYLL